MLSKQTNRSSNQITIYLALAVLFAIGLWLRLRFIHTVQLYPDEFVTLLAVRMIGEKGVPQMPSGLFYDHGLLFSYLGSIAANFGPPQLWVRYASLIFGMLSLGLTYLMGRRWFSPAAGLIATAGLVIAPTAIHWGGRARMYALLQLLVLLTLWLTYEGVVHSRARWRWAALLAYLGALLTHFVSITLAPALALGAVSLWWLRGQTGDLTSRRAAPTPNFNGARSLATPASLDSRLKHGSVWLEAVGFMAIIAVGFLVKRAGQPKGIAPLESSQAFSAVAQVFAVYGNISFDLVEDWQAIAPFFLSLPALIFLPFALLAIAQSWISGRAGAREAANHGPKGKMSPNRPNSLPVIFLTIILVMTTFEMILFVSPDRRDDKYLFMLLPVLLLLGAQGMAVVGDRLLAVVKRQPSTNTYGTALNTHNALRPRRYVPRSRSYVLRFIPLIAAALILLVTKADVDTLLANTGDDYATAFAYVKAHWQEGDTILTGTPAAAAFYLGHNDFYSVQRRGGYDYRILTVNEQPVDRWLASPAVRTEADLHQTLAGHKVWLVLERWGLQREYYDLPFQQQLLAQTEHVGEVQAQGIFILRSKPDPRPLAFKPIQPVEAVFGDSIRLTGYTVEPEGATPGHPVRLTVYWQALALLPHNYTAFVHLRSPDGTTVAQADHRPLGDLFPTSLWPAGETIRESSDLFLTADLPPGTYELWTGLYLFETGQRLSVQNDKSGEHAVKLGVLSVAKTSSN